MMLTDNAREHLSGYQARDFEVADYRMYKLADTGLQFRGPVPANLASGDYFTCIGAAQTFGCFCEYPYPALLENELGVQVLNLGYGGAGPEFFARQHALHKYVNHGRFVVVQVMSARSQSNSMFDCGGLEYLVRRSDGVSLGANEAYRELLAGSSLLRKLPFRTSARLLARLTAVPKVRRIVAETRRAWINSYRDLLGRFKVPVILFWFSKRTPTYCESLRSVKSLFGDFPQLVNAEMVASLRDFCDDYVECVTDRGSPHLLVSRFTGERVKVDPSLDRPDLGGGGLWTHNRYYPSPQMHEDAAQALNGACKRLLS